MQFSETQMPARERSPNFYGVGGRAGGMQKKLDREIRAHKSEAKTSDMTKPCASNCDITALSCSGSRLSI